MIVGLCQLIGPAITGAPLSAVDWAGLSLIYFVCLSPPHPGPVVWVGLGGWQGKAASRRPSQYPLPLPPPTVLVPVGGGGALGAGSWFHSVWKQQTGLSFWAQGRGSLSIVAARGGVFG